MKARNRFRSDVPPAVPTDEPEPTDAEGFTFIAIISGLSWLIAWGLYIYLHP